MIDFDFFFCAGHVGRAWNQVSAISSAMGNPTESLSEINIADVVE